VPRIVGAAAAFLVLVSLGFASRASADQAFAGERPLRTAVFSPTFSGPTVHSDFAQIADLGTSAVVLAFNWGEVASPEAGSAPDFDPRDPGSPYYNWSSFDEGVRTASAHGLEVIAVVLGAPTWALESAEPGAPPTLPNPAAFGDFAAAAAARFSGGYAGLPAVRYWEAWNEPNISFFLAPQFVDGEPISPAWYRRMLNEFYDGVKSVALSSKVIGGGTAPFFDRTPEVTAIDPAWGPLSFMRHLLCLSETLEPTCNTPTKFDIWATHPYVEGSPSRRASLPNDVSVADLPRMRAVLEAAQEAGHVVSSEAVEFWAPEFSWDSSPPDPKGVPQSVLARWVPQALYDMWRSGISLVAWLTLHDGPWDFLHSGLLLDGAPKEHARRFAFPLVGVNHRDQLEVWGRTPGGRPANVIIEQLDSGAWSTLGTLSSDGTGIFQGRFDAWPTGLIRATAAALGEQSANFPLGADPYVNTVYEAFGNGMLEPEPTWHRPAIPEPPSGGSSRRIEVEQRLRKGEAP
jgi:hypothetical protein